MIEHDTGGGGGGGVKNNKNNGATDQIVDDLNNIDDNNNNNNNNNDDDDHEPCSKKVMPALFAWFLLISTSSSYFTLVLPEYINLIGMEHIELFITIVGLHAFVFLYVILNFSIATFMDPGRFPRVDMKETIEDDGVLHHSGTYKNVLINDINVRMKWCTTCQFYRPPRSSHCGVCNACIDTMDHHCPWVCNCIARRNYKYFLQFLISLSIHMLSIFGLCLTLVLFNKDNLTHIPIIIAQILIVIIGLLIIPIGGLTGFHIVLVSRGRTTNEQVNICIKIIISFLKWIENLKGICNMKKLEL
jgi:palmitoyltransferase ZDHHC5/8